MTRKRFRRVLTALTVVNRALARGKLGLGMGSGENSFISAPCVVQHRQGKGREASNRLEWKIWKRWFDEGSSTEDRINDKCDKS